MMTVEEIMEKEIQEAEKKICYIADFMKEHNINSKEEINEVYKFIQNMDWLIKKSYITLKED